jgi:hypothetical protein
MMALKAKRRAVLRAPRAPPPPRRPLSARLVSLHSAVLGGAFFLLAAAALSGELEQVVTDDRFEGRMKETGRFYASRWVVVRASGL